MKELLEKFLKEQGFFVNFEIHIEPCDFKKGEKVIGEMNDLEKSLYTFICVKQKEHGELIEKMKKADEADDSETLEKLIPEHVKNHLIVDLAGKIMWTSIDLRFETFKESKGIGVRKGFKVVEMNEENCPSENEMIIPDFGAVITLRMKN
jgi:hypothetical protein